MRDRPAVEVGAGTVHCTPAEVLAGIRDYCEEQGVERLRDLIGALELP
ncbi:MAG: hypothetical protein U5N86_14105 [Planctomycetota bacterium]|nr:hypothetical protein [Planctomycetota bacterium]